MQLKTRQGVLRGARERGVLAFRGIPYARPPVGAGRFAPPEAAPAWSGARDATRFAPGQPQRGDPFIERLGLGPVGASDEDSLYLNVWTPAADDARRPVLVWIHGGAFIGGSASTPLYDGRRLAERGDVVVVTLNYRVGLLGFAFLDGVSPNLGLQDQLAALRWVREEIAQFGGDPDNVTIFGESAGAGSGVALLAMPGARGLFRRAIIQSAAPDGMIDPPEATRRAALLLGRLGLDPARADLERLRELSVEQILRAQATCAAEDGPFDFNMLFLPVIDGSVLPVRPLHALRDGRAHAVDLIIGTTREEMRLFAREPAFASITQRQLTRHAAHRGLDGEWLSSFRAELEARGARTTPPALLCALETDRILRIPSTRIAGWHASRNARAYMYLFTWPSPMFDGELESCHAVDLPFTFGTLEARGMPEFAGGGLLAKRLSETMRDAWTAFARDGDPSHSGIGHWPTYDTEKRRTLLLGSHCEVVDAPLEAERALWDGLI